MLTKKGKKKPNPPAVQPQKPKRMWAGKVPENVVSRTSKPVQEAPKEKKLVYKGYAGSAGIIVDTSAGKINLKQDETKKEEDQKNKGLEQLKQSQLDQNKREIGESAILEDDSDSDEEEEQQQEKVEEKREVQINDEVESDDEDLFGDVDDEQDKPKQQTEQNKELKFDEIKLPEVKREPQETKVLDEKSEESEEEEEEESEDEEQSEEEPEEVAPLLRPVFVKKDERNTIAEAQESEESKAEKLEETRKAQVQKLIEKDREEDNKSEESDGNDELPDDTDHKENELEEYEKWKEREFARIKRNIQEEEEAEKEKHEVERRRKLTQEQRDKEDKKLGSDKTDHKEGRQYNFMQKYYKLGPFNIDLAKKGGKYDILNRDYNIPLASEKRDISALPRVMQVRRGEFGKRGQSKWTHLTNEDTTQHDPDWKVPEAIFKKQQMRTGGYKGADSFERPSKRYRRG